MQLNYELTKKKHYRLCTVHFLEVPEMFTALVLGVNKLMGSRRSLYRWCSSLATTALLIVEHKQFLFGSPLLLFSITGTLKPLVIMVGNHCREET